MEAHVFKIQNDNLSIVFKGYVTSFNGKTKTKHWCEGVHKTYGEAERSAKKLLTTLRKEKSMC